MSSRVGRRKSKTLRLALLTPWQRWALVYGNPTSTAFESPADWQTAYALHRDALLDEIHDPATGFRGFWLHDPDVPDELRTDLHRAGHVLLDEPRASEVKAEYDLLLERRRRWLHANGYR